MVTYEEIGEREEGLRGPMQPIDVGQDAVVVQLSCSKTRQFRRHSNVWLLYMMCKGAQDVMSPEVDLARVHCIRSVTIVELALL